MEMERGFTSQPMPFISIGEHTSSQTLELRNQSRSEVIHVRGENHGNNWNSGGAKTVVDHSGDIRTEGVAMVSSVEVVYFDSSKSIRRCSSVSHQVQQ